MDVDTLRINGADLSDLHTMLAALAHDLRACCADRWTVIGSAAAKLAGADVSVADIDLLVSRHDADLLAARWVTRRQAVAANGGEALFRSRFARYAFAPWIVEVMGDLELHGEHGWQAVRVDETVDVELGDISVTIPTLAGQMHLLEAFGRPKDLRRAAILRTMVQG